MRDEDTLSLGVLPAHETLSWYTSAALGDCTAAVTGSPCCFRGVLKVKLVGASGAVECEASPSPADALGSTPPSDERMKSPGLQLVSEETVDLSCQDAFSGGVDWMVSCVVALRASVATSGVEPMLLIRDSPRLKLRVTGRRAFDVVDELDASERLKQESLTWSSSPSSTVGSEMRSEGPLLLCRNDLAKVLRRSRML